MQTTKEFLLEILLLLFYQFYTLRLQAKGCFIKVTLMKRKNFKILILSRIWYINCARRLFLPIKKLSMLIGMGNKSFRRYNIKQE